LTISSGEKGGGGASGLAGVTNATAPVAAMVKTCRRDMVLITTSFEAIETVALLGRLAKLVLFRRRAAADGWSIMAEPS
jgi:hypothetical protein